MHRCTLGSSRRAAAATTTGRHHFRFYRHTKSEQLAIASISLSEGNNSQHSGEGHNSTHSKTIIAPGFGKLFDNWSAGIHPTMTMELCSVSAAGTGSLCKGRRRESLPPAARV
jgi:hypothetical protein